MAALVVFQETHRTRLRAFFCLISFSLLTISLYAFDSCAQPRAELHKKLTEIQRLHIGQAFASAEPAKKQRAQDLASAELIPGRKKHGLQGLYDAADLQNAINNIKVDPWAKAVFEAVMVQAHFWAGIPDSVLYDLLPSANPRALTPSQYQGCPIHGGNRLTLETSLAHPYQYRCTVGGEWWYNGVAVKNPESGEKTLVNDAGAGWVAPAGFAHPGETYYFQGAYRLYLILKLFAIPYGPEIPDDTALLVDNDPSHSGESKKTNGWKIAPARALALAYAWTQDSLYAHKAGVLINRMAEIYPHLNGSKEGYSVYDEWKDPIRGYVSESSGREQLFLNSFLEIYDLIYDGFSQDRTLAEFFARQGSADANGDGVYTTHDLTSNVECNMLAFALEFIDRTVTLAPGDFLMSSLGSLLRLAGVMDSQPLLHRLYEGTNNFPLLMTNSFFRDGRWWYDSAGYSLHNAQRIAELEEWLHGRIPAVDQERSARILTFPLRIDCDGRLPLIGDTGNSRSAQSAEANGLVQQMARKHLGAALALPRELPSVVSDEDIWTLFHAAPSAMKEQASEPLQQSELFHDSGFAILRSGSSPADRIHLVLNFGKGSTAHGHMDKLAFNIIEHGYDLSADIGYPASWISRKISGWETHSLSHATVLIDRQNQSIAIGSLRSFFSEKGIQIIEAEAPRAYPNLNPLYRRAMALVEKDSLHRYVVDVFRVQGGHEYDYSFHSLGKDDGSGLEIKTLQENLQWQEQGRGTLAHPDSAFGTTPGYGWLTDVRTCQSDTTISAAWHVGESSTGIVLHMIGEPAANYFTAKGEGNGNVGQSPWDPYLVARRKDMNGKGKTFVAVYEPFQGRPIIDQITAEHVVNPSSCETDLLLRIRFQDASEHLVFIGHDENSSLTSLDGSWRFRGQWGFWNQEQNFGLLAKGRELVVHNKVKLKSGPTVTGTITSIDRPLGQIKVRLASPAAKDVVWCKKVLLVRNPDYCSASSYEISDLQSKGHLASITIANPDLLLSRCSIMKTVSAAADTIYPANPLAKIENFPGLFDGKMVASSDGRKTVRLATTKPGRLIFAKGSVANMFKAGEQVEILDIAVGDRIEIPLSVFGNGRRW